MSKAFLGIDVSKKELVIALLCDNQSIHKGNFNNSQSGFKKIIRWLVEKKVTVTKVCMEATGDYGTQCADYLYYKGYEVNVVNPLCIKSFAKSKLVRTKTDYIDARIIAEYASKSNHYPYKPKSPVLKELKYLYRCLEDLKKQSVSISNQLENKECLPKSVLSSWKRLLNSIKKEIKTVEKNLSTLLSENAEINSVCCNLETIPGIGKITAIAIIAESPDITSFGSARQYAAYAGLVPKHRRSGSSIQGRARLSKLGSAKLRKAMYFPAIVAKNHNLLMKEFTTKLKKKGKHTMVIIGAIMHKLLRIIFGILKSKTAFDYQYTESA